MYAGRFQPFHKGHYASYQQLVKKFGKDNVYIGTSDKTDNIKSPLRFKEKKAIMMTMFGIPSNKIVQIKNPYAPMEIMDKFPEETTAFITVVGEKDRYRLKGKYFEPYHPDRVTKGYKEAGYVYVTTAQGPAGGMSGTEARELLLKGSEADKIAGFKKVYDGKFDSKIYKLITTKLEKVFGKLERFISTIDMNRLMVEAGIYRADPGEPETGYLPGGTTRKLGDNFGKPEPWYSAGGYTQMEFPKADYIYSKDSTGSDKAAFSVVKRVEPNKDLDKPIEADDYLTSETGEPIIGMNEASSLGPIGKSMVDDGPGFTYGNSKSYRKVGDDAAEALGWQVVDYILGTDDDSIYADSLRTLDDKYPVSYFPSGADGIDAQSQRYNIMKSSDAYKAWSKKIKGVATAVGYQLIDFLDAEDSKTNNPNEPTKETTPNFTVDSKTERLGEGIRESIDKIKWQASVNSTYTDILTEGGAYGHMNHPFDVEMNLTFGDLKAIIKGALTGNLEFTREKCVYGAAIIQTENNGEITLKEFVDGDIDDKVLSYDEITQTNQYKNVMAKLNNDDADEWLEIELEDDKIIQVTPNHRIYVEGKGYVRAKDLAEDMELKII